MKQFRIFLILILGFCYSAVNAQLLKDQQGPVLVTDTMKLAAPANFAPTLPDTVSIIGVGDIMLGTNFPSSKYLPSGDGSQLLKPLLPILNDATLTFGNLEGAYSDSLPVTKSCRDTANCYAFRSPDYLFPNIVEAGFDVLGMSNNHSGDLGLPGRRNTIRLIEEAGLEHVGLLESPMVVVEKRGLKFGFCAFSPNTGTCDINNLPEAERIVRKLEQQCDVVVVSFHGGAEGSKYQKMPKKREIFLGENRGDVYEFAHRMVDAGADIVFGHGPHVIRAMDLYKDRFIIYSLGNFCTYSRMKVSGVNGLAPIIKVFTDREGKFLKGKIYPAYQIKGTGTRMDPYKRAIAKIRELTKQDLPELKVHISEDGVITQ